MAKKSNGGAKASKGTASWKDLSPPPESVYPELVCLYGRLRGTHEDTTKALYAGATVMAYGLAQIADDEPEEDPDELPQEAPVEHGEPAQPEPDENDPSAQQGAPQTPPNPGGQTTGQPAGDRASGGTSGGPTDGSAELPADPGRAADTMERYFPQLTEEGKPTKTKGKEAMKAFAQAAPSPSAGWTDILLVVAPILLDWLKSRRQ
jgi:hypothetical protein